MKYPEACIIVFAREPVAGKVKTRLIPALGAEGAKDLHLKLISRVFKLVQESSLCPSQLWVDNNPAHEAFDRFVGLHQVQSGADLGERMHNAAVQVLAHYKSVIIIGSDCPDMDEAYLEQALQALEKHEVKVVLGPAVDGGYVLIGMSQAVPEAFEAVDWGSEKVMEQTRQRLRDNDINCYELSELNDIDRPEDLKLL